MQLFSLNHSIVCTNNTYVNLFQLQEKLNLLDPLLHLTCLKDILEVFKLLQQKTVASKERMKKKTLELHTCMPTPDPASHWGVQN